MTKYKIGIDVGSTHTDAVLLDEKNRIAHSEKTMTTQDVTEGILNALKLVLEKSKINKDDIAAIMFGTTHIINAIVQRRGLGRVGVIRIGLPATEAIEPLLDWPNDLRSAVLAASAMIRGGHDYTGEPIVEFDEDKSKKVLERFRELKVDAIAVTSVFSTVNNEHEMKIKEIANKLLPGTPVVLSHEISSIGLLERENATVLNAATINVMRNAMNALKKALDNLGISHAKMYFAQNDGTTALAEYILRFPIFTTIAPVSNSIRGAYVLTGIPNAIVADTGGTTTNIGALINGYPRETLEVEIGGVRTNIRAPDLIAIGLAGGSIVKFDGKNVNIGPVSVGYRLIKEGIAWGGETITATDIALAKGVMKIDDPNCNVNLAKAKIPEWLVELAYNKMVSMLEDYLDRIKTKPEPETVILVGGGSLMWPKNLKLAKEVIRPEHAQYANAVGAATALVGSTVEKAYSYERIAREKAIQEVSEEAKLRAIEAGAEPGTIEIVEVEEVAMPYLPGTAVKIRVKAVGKLKL